MNNNLALVNEFAIIITWGMLQPYPLTLLQGVRMTSLFEIKTKKCSKCKQEKTLDKFCKNKKTKDGYESWCGQCKNKQNKVYYEAHKEQVKEKSKTWRDSHKEHCYQVEKAWRDSHKEVCRKLNRDWYKNHPEKKEASKKKFWESPKGKALAARGYYKRKTAHKTVINDLTAQQWEEIKQKQNYTCLHCGKKEPEINLTRDHIIPVSKGGGLTKNNVQGLCSICNCKKHTKIDSQGFQNILKGETK